MSAEANTCGTNTGSSSGESAEARCPCTASRSYATSSGGTGYATTNAGSGSGGCNVLLLCKLVVELLDLLLHSCSLLLSRVRREMQRGRRVWRLILVLQLTLEKGYLLLEHRNVLLVLLLLLL